VSSRALAAVTYQAPEILSVALTKIGRASGEAPGQITNQVVGTAPDRSHLPVQECLKCLPNQIRSPDSPLASLLIHPLEERLWKAE
jgi:hypothetical protein